MKLLIDFGAIKAGGGVQLALNFIDLLKEKVKDRSKIYLLMPEVGELSTKELGDDWGGVYVSPKSYISRLLFEKYSLKNTLRSESIDVVYTFFGAGLNVPNKVRNIVSMAYPIVCYPDSEYWKHVGFKEKLFKRLINRFRMYRLKKADLVIVETEVMKSRLSRFLGSSGRIQVIPPAPTEYVSYVERNGAKTPIKFLILSGNAPHKNIWRLEPLIKALVEVGQLDFKIQLSMTKEVFLADKRNKLDPDVAEYIDFLGPIHPEDVGSAYGSSDFLISLSDLESFSNNYMEAWKSGTPMFVSDRDFARNICESSAEYIEPHNPMASAKVISKCLSEPDKYRKMRDKGSELIANLPTTEERFSKIWQIINEKH